MQSINCHCCKKLWQMAGLHSDHPPGLQKRDTGPACVCGKLWSSGRPTLYKNHISLQIHMFQ
jgi:hypothetical protein